MNVRRRRTIVVVALTLAAALAAPPVPAAGSDTSAAVTATSTAQPKKLGCSSPEALANANESETTAVREPQNTAAAASPRVVFKLNTAEDAPAILRFVTNYLAVEPTAKVAVVGYAGGIDFMLQGAVDANGKPYAEQLAALAARGVAFKVCNNTLKARNLTAAAVSPNATVVPGAVNEIIRLQTKEGYAYFQN